MDTDTTRPTAPADIKFRGVYKRSSGRYTAQLYVDGAVRTFGTYGTAEEAARAYDRAAQAQFGDEAGLNYIDGTLNPLRFNVASIRTSEYRGVYYAKRQKRFRAAARVGGRTLHIGYFKNDEDAAKAYDRFVKEKMPTTGILNFLPDGSLNPDRNIDRRHGGVALASVADNTEERDEEEEEEEVEVEEQQQHKHAKQRRLNENLIIDLTDVEPMHTPSAPRSVNHMVTPVPVRAMSSAGGGRASGKSAAFNGRRGMPAVGGGGPDGPIQPLSLPSQPAPTATRGAVTPASASSMVKEEAVAVPLPAYPAHVKVETSAAVPTPAAFPGPLVKVEASAALPTPAPLHSALRIKTEAVPVVPAPAPLLTASVNVEASVAVPSSSSSSAAQSMAGNGLKMTLLQAVSILGAKAYKRLAACEQGSEQMESLQRLLQLLPQPRREARDAGASSSSSSASSGSSHADLRAFLLTSVCPRYTTEELTGSHLDNVMQISLCMVKL